MAAGAAEGRGGLLGSILTSLFYPHLPLLAVLTLGFKQIFTIAKTSLKQRSKVNNNHKDNGNVCTLLLCFWLLLVPLGQCFNVDKMEKQTQKVTDYTAFSNEMPKWNFFGHGSLVIYSITR